MIFKRNGKNILPAFTKANLLIGYLDSKVCGFVCSHFSFPLIKMLFFESKEWHQYVIIITFFPAGRRKALIDL